LPGTIGESVVAMGTMLGNTLGAFVNVVYSCVRCPKRCALCDDRHRMAHCLLATTWHKLAREQHRLEAAVTTVQIRPLCFQLGMPTKRCACLAAWPCLQHTHHASPTHCCRQSARAKAITCPSREAHSRRSSACFSARTKDPETFARGHASAVKHWWGRCARL